MRLEPLGARHGKNAMNAFRVWVRALGNCSRVRVEGDQNARWLLDRLEQSFAFKSGEPLRRDVHNASCTFRVPYGSHVSRDGLERLLAAIPEVTLMAEPD